jgi:hypothetical protein
MMPCVSFHSGASFVDAIAETFLNNTYFTTSTPTSTASVHAAGCCAEFVSHERFECNADRSADSMIATAPQREILLSVAERIILVGIPARDTQPAPHNKRRKNVGRGLDRVGNQRVCVSRNSGHKLGRGRRALTSMPPAPSAFPCARLRSFSGYAQGSNDHTSVVTGVL